MVDVESDSTSGTARRYLNGGFVRKAPPFDWLPIPVNSIWDRSLCVLEFDSKSLSKALRTVSPLSCAVGGFLRSNVHVLSPPLLSFFRSFSFWKLPFDWSTGGSDVTSGCCCACLTLFDLFLRHPVIHQQQANNPIRQASPPITDSATGNIDGSDTWIFNTYKYQRLEDSTDDYLMDTYVF